MEFEIFSSQILYDDNWDQVGEKGKIENLFIVGRVGERRIKMLRSNRDLSEERKIGRVTTSRGSWKKWKATRRNLLNGEVENEKCMREGKVFSLGGWKSFPFIFFSAYEQFEAFRAWVAKSSKSK